MRWHLDFSPPFFIRVHTNFSLFVPFFLLLSLLFRCLLYLCSYTTYCLTRDD